MSVTITRNGVPSVALLRMEQTEGFVDTVEILSDQKSMYSLRRSLK